MKNFIPMIVGFLISCSSTAHAKETNYKKLNGGPANIGGVVWYGGCSYLWGKTITTGKRYLDYQMGVAIPTLLTAKVSTGLEFDNYRIGVLARPWPLSVGAEAHFGISSKFTYVVSYERWGLMQVPHSDMFMTFGKRWKPYNIKL